MKEYSPMPHYADGTEARIGDRVRGAGYNLVGPDKKPLEIEGVVVNIRPGQDKAGSCTLSVAYLRNGMSPSGHIASGAISHDRGFVRIGIEYGDTVGFDKLPEMSGY
jgi:hypothetical protein